MSGVIIGRVHRAAPDDSQVFAHRWMVRGIRAGAAALDGVKGKRTFMVAIPSRSEAPEATKPIMVDITSSLIALGWQEVEAEIIEVKRVR